MLIFSIACSDFGSRLFDWSGGWTRFAARAFARAAQIGANRRIEAYAKSLLRHQRKVAAPELQIH
jgi:hypothetical protein